MSDLRQVKVDNWGIYFLQRLKHFFNRTDYCDLTLQFQDNAQLKVHRLILSACTEYFELLERTCEMYEDCLVMPDDLQADVVVPIINFMYTGQLEFRLDLLEKLYQTSLIMSMPVLTKLLDAHRSQQKQPPAKRPFPTSTNYYGKRYSKLTKTIPVPSNSNGNKRPLSNVFDDPQTDTPKAKKTTTDMFSKAECIVKNGKSASYQFPVFSEKNNHLAKEPRPTRYELPEELDEENLFDNSFSNISYGSKPLMVHPEKTKQYEAKRISLFEEGTSTSRYMRNNVNDLVECRKISVNEGIFVDSFGESIQDEYSSHIKDEVKDTSQLFDQILEDNTPKITIDTKNNTQAQIMDHAKIISEVLKKYPHLVKSNKKFKLKILNTAKTKKPHPSNSSNEEKIKPKNEPPDFTYESDVLNSKEAARLIALGAENIAGPWICLICGTPGKALHFTSYLKFRKHLVDIHNEKPVPTICEYCGVKSLKRNYLVHHKLTKHGVPAPLAYNFPKCNQCSYIALNEALLIKHKTSHSDKSCKFNMPLYQMSAALSKMSQKYPSPTVSTEKKVNLQCIYCLRVFLRDHNLIAHLKINHKEAAKNDGLIDDSEEEQEEDKFSSNIKLNNESSNLIKVEVPVTFDNIYEDVNEQYQIEQKADGSIYVLTKKPRNILPSNKNKILNLNFSSSPQNVASIKQKPDSAQNASIKKSEFLQNSYISQARSDEDTVIIDNNEYILQDNQLIPKNEKMSYIISQNANDSEIRSMIPTTSVEYPNIHTLNPEQHKMVVKKSSHLNQPLQIVVSNEEEYKALVNSNQTVIYEEAESNKTLSELGGPDNTSLETGTIDLDNTQTNDMMIIPDFPMNVPETVSADNSNIVVVYSHPVEDQNKHYSLITTQGLEGEFVQSSAIITQNYETVTTCTPVVNTQMAIGNSWQSNVHDISKISYAPSMELQTMTVGESIAIAPVETVSSSSLNNLSEVQLTASEPVTVELAQTDNIRNTFDQANVINSINEQSDSVSVCEQNTVITLAESNVLDNMQQQTQIQPMSPTNTNQTVSINQFDQVSERITGEPKPNEAVAVASDSVELKSCSIGSVVVEEILHNENDTPSTEIVPVIVTQSNMIGDSTIEDTHSQVDHVTVLKDNNESIAPDTNIAEKVEVESEKLQETVFTEKESQFEENVENIANDTTVNQLDFNNDEQCVIEQNTSDVRLTNIAKEQIQNLTSEWSEEECEPGKEESNDNSQTKNEDTADSADTEESIENIQKEVEKHSVQIAGDLCSEPDEIVVTSQDDSNYTKSQTATQEVKIVTPDSKDKITSLLNDWDDNDSQEDVSFVINENENNTANNDSPIDKSVINKNDKIKCLVSDWDEEDENENKES